MTTTNPTTTWHLSQMPNLIDTLRQLSNAGVEIIGITTKTAPPHYFEIHCWHDDDGKYAEWFLKQEWEFRERKDETYPNELVAWVNGCKVFTLFNQKMMEEWDKEADRE